MRSTVHERFEGSVRLFYLQLELGAESPGFEGLVRLGEHGCDPQGGRQIGALRVEFESLRSERSPPLPVMQLTGIIKLRPP